jgi:hypothetical protein
MRSSATAVRRTVRSSPQACARAVEPVVGPNAACQVRTFALVSEVTGVAPKVG